MKILLREFSQEERERLAKEGKALPDGSFPIVTVEDLKNAIQALGRASDPDRARKHIIKRARALRATNLLPKNWEAVKAESILAGYTTIADLPAAVKSNYSERCQRVFMRVFNTTFNSGYAEERAFQNAHTAAKNCASST